MGTGPPGAGLFVRPSSYAEADGIGERPGRFSARSFSADGDLFVSSQDTNVVTAFYGPKSPSRCASPRDRNSPAISAKLDVCRQFG